jgi:hypothetical protein
MLKPAFVDIAMAITKILKFVCFLGVTTLLVVFSRAP